jgi:hypothetical protein
MDGKERRMPMDGWYFARSRVGGANMYRMFGCGTDMSEKYNVSIFKTKYLQ